MEAKDGFVKLLANPKTGEILGGSVRRAESAAN